MIHFPVKKQGYSLGNWVKIMHILNDPFSGQKARLQSWELGENQPNFDGSISGQKARLQSWELGENQPNFDGSISGQKARLQSWELGENHAYFE